MLVESLGERVVSLQKTTDEHRRLLCQVLLGRKIRFLILGDHERFGVVSGVMGENLLRVKETLNTWFDIGLEQIVEVLR